MESVRVGFWVFPVVGNLDLGFDAGLFGQKVEEVGATEEFEGLALSELERRLSVTTGRNEDPFDAPSFCVVP
jgi:hypothetical protein